MADATASPNGERQSPGRGKPLRICQWVRPRLSPLAQLLRRRHGTPMADATASPNGVSEAPPLGGTPVAARSETLLQHWSHRLQGWTHSLITICYDYIILITILSSKWWI